jgi:hypothetical protein
MHRALGRWVWERKLDVFWKAYVEGCSSAALRVWKRALLSKPERPEGDRGSQRRNTYWYCVPRFILRDIVADRKRAAARKAKVVRDITPKGRARPAR